MRESSTPSDSNIPEELLCLYQRIESNAKTFGMPPAEVAIIKKECKLAYQHKLILAKIALKKSE